MKDDFASLYAYNRWADRRVLDACRKLTHEQYTAEPVPGWSSVRSSLFHIGVATDGWLCRLAGEDTTQTTPNPTEEEYPTVADVERLLDHAYRTFESLVPKLTPDWLTAPQTFSRRGRTAVLPPWAVLRHVVNHGTYHRGQVASKLKRLGVEPPMPDFAWWVMEQVPQQG